MSSIVQILHNPVVAKLKHADREAQLAVSELLSYVVSGAEFTNRFRDRNWDGRQTLFDFATGKFPAGFVPRVMHHLQKLGYTVQSLCAPLPAPLGLEGDALENFDGLGGDTRYEYQKRTVDELEKRGRLIAMLATGCHAKGTKILMFDGSLKNVEDIKVGDVLMGPDSKSRNVLRLYRGREEMFKIIPTKGDSYVVNRSHVLSLRMTGLRGRKVDGYEDGEIVNISVNDYLQKGKTFKHCAKGWRTGVEFPHVDLPKALSPYQLGVWLGDESKDASAITSIDKGKVPNHVLRELKNQNLLFNKHIPSIYKVNSSQNRLELLAGLIDTDGYLHHGFVEIVTKYEVLANDIAFLARSLGFAAYIKQTKKSIKSTGFCGNYWRISIFGDLDQIPCRVKRHQAQERRQVKNVLNVGIRVESVGEGDYYGFEVDGDHLYVMGDFTVTHNSGKSRVASMAYARIKRPTLFLTTRSVLMYQIKKRFEKDHNIRVGVLGDGEWSPTNEINVGMVQTLAPLLTPLDVEVEIARWNRSWKDGIVKKLAERRDALIKAKMMPAEVEKILAKELKAYRDQKPDPDQIRRSVTARVEQHNKRHRQTLDLLSKFEFVIGEEAHEAGGDGYYNVIQACKNAYYRLALTATPFMRSDGEDNMRLMAAFGEIGIRVTEKRLIDAGILAKPYFKYVDTERPKNLYRTTGWQRAYKYGIVENPHRNGVIINEALRAKQYGLPTLILVQHTRHGELLKKALKQAGATVEFIHGAHEQREREHCLNALACRKLDILIGSTILDVGVDVPAVGVIILAGGGKAEVALRQRIGRGLRAKKNGPNVAFILDFVDSENEHLRNHGKQRRAIVQQTPGFAEGILAPGQDFDYSIFGK
ncbi:Hint domain-containing homing endonuclease [Methylocaldum szegediense]|uniref:Hint domain-containing homing endonuclease n=1 Tax=Methylocaldum szegediense TaxID=73780 RepID=UPI000429F374|nr:Hint domain-containing homing endonuclease [Methylocaldum szegediense]